MLKSINMLEGITMNYTRCIQGMALAMTAIALTILVPGIIWASDENPKETPLNDIKDIAELQAAFDADAGTARLILLLSPT